MIDDLQPIPIEYLVEQGFCCGNECQNCPYIDDEGNRFQVGSTKIDLKLVNINETKK